MVVECKAAYLDAPHFVTCRCCLEAGHAGKHLCYDRRCGRRWVDGEGDGDKVSQGGSGAWGKKSGKAGE